MTKKPSKAEARLLRKIEKDLKDKSKSVRLSSDVEVSSKNIRIETRPSLTKEARLAVSPHSYKDCCLTWSIDHADREGSWTWKNRESREWSVDEYTSEIEPHINSYISIPWKEVEAATYNGKHQARKLLNKYQPIDSLCDEAQIRWMELERLSEFEEIFRFRMGSNKRAWGIRIQHHFYLIWYERHHQICPIDS